MTDIKRIEAGPRMSQAVVHNGIVYLAGQVAKGADAKPMDTKTQTQVILSQIDKLLSETGSSKSRLLTAQIWLANIADFGAMNEAWEAWVDKANTPARATGEVKLAAPEYTVEIIVTAAVG